jgi:hypothetical protein
VILVPVDTAPKDITSVCAAFAQTLGSDQLSIVSAFGGKLDFHGNPEGYDQISDISSALNELMPSTMAIAE